MYYDEGGHDMAYIHDLLKFIYDNWTLIIACIGLIILIKRKYEEWEALSEEEKVDIALKALKNQLLEMMSEAEIAWDDYKKTGEIKKSQVFQTIYDKFPILKEYCDQDKLADIISDMIDELKPEMDKIINAIDSEIEETKTPESNIDVKEE